MFNNQIFGVPGMVQNQNQPMPKIGSWLSNEQIQMLQKGIGQFKLSVTEEELTAGQCNHYNRNGTSALIPDADGSGGCTCSLCGTHFNSREYTQEDVQNATQNILDILNTIKIMYLSIDPKAALEYFQILPFVAKIPQLYNIAVADFKKYEGVGNFSQANNQNPFAMFSAMMSGQPMMYQQQPMYGQAQPMYQQPVYAQPGQPVMGAMPGQPVYGQPMVNPMTGQPMAPQAAPAAAPGYAPQPTGYAFNPQGAAQPVVNTNMPAAAPQAAPAAPATDPVKVDTQFKK